MKPVEPRTIRLNDYSPAPYRIARIALNIALDPQATRVHATMQVERVGKAGPLMLHGRRLKLLAVKLDGSALDAASYQVDDQTLTIADMPERGTLEVTTEIAPEANTALEGLYMAGGMYCTQCEPEGFRCITYFLDRPDNLAIFETRIEAPLSYPELLSNGNLIEAAELPNGRHYARWQDPFPKPSYLFAMVAGDLGHIRDSFTTMSGRKVDLRIYVEHGNEDRALYAMDSLKRSMRWDEETYGREYDLDIFMIVAVSAFNFGAMENKGLNIFNDKVLLASPETATDDDYARIESVVAHEYFHNWSGNRVTCRDWFQLSLKEGLTVFREYGFSADQRSRAVRRIEDVKALRLRQFQEDGGPLAHPVQPQSYIAIDNFYTATVYEKGSELVGMIRTLLGPQDFRKGMDLYFERHDGEAATVEDFVRCFEEVARRDLTQFRLWYSQAGTPRVRVHGAYDADAKTYTLDLTQHLPPTPGQPEKHPMLIPLMLGLIGKESGEPLTLRLLNERVGGIERVIELNAAENRFIFIDVPEEPELSIGRHFSAPVIIEQQALDQKTGRSARAFLMRRDPDAFNRWEAGQMLTRDVLREMIAAVQAGQKPKADPLYLESMGEVIARAGEDHAFAALMLIPPSELELAFAMDVIDPDAIHAARKALIVQIAAAHGPALASLYRALESNEAFSPDARSAGRRSLRNACLRFLTADDDAAAAALAHEHYSRATNMTDMMAGLAALARMTDSKRDAAFAHFHQRFASDPLVLDKWMGLQATSPSPDTLERVRALMKNPAFAINNPNRVRALIGAFAMANPLRFHAKDGAGYRLFREVLRALDPINPSTAARMATAFESWRRFDPERRALMRAELEAIAALPGISANLYEIVTRTLDSGTGKSPS